MINLTQGIIERLLNGMIGWSIADAETAVSYCR